EQRAPGRGDRGAGRAPAAGSPGDADVVTRPTRRVVAGILRGIVALTDRGSPAGAAGDRKDTYPSGHGRAAPHARPGADGVVTYDAARAHPTRPAAVRARLARCRGAARRRAAPRGGMRFVQPRAAHLARSGG